jgi:inner membrane transporter RhtA
MRFPLPRALPAHPLAIAIVILAIFGFQGGASLAKRLFPLFGAEGMAAMRLLFSALIMSAIFRPWRGALTRKECGLLLAYGLSMGGMNLTFYMALKTLPQGITVAIEFMGPLSVALLSSRSPLDFLWALVAAIGILLLMPLQGTDTLDPLGVFYALVAAACWALYIVFGQKVGRTLQSQRAAALGIVVAACLVFPIGAGDIDINALNIATFLLVIAVAALSSALPYSFEMFALQKLPAKTFGIMMSLEPAFAALLGFVFLGERLNSNQWIAIFCIILASAGSAAFSKHSIAEQDIHA